ncbi:methionyl-tRNA formyltransferase [Beijerinckia sp. L45]|uniref:methionyl-tRNA formyltransferase n=1 Tax=Beijerinckia sp. L45 TaxID=1641855 RepID=UPI00131BF51B|nr:methionyl-tRNA formyltransferase [Beijerinckia sp. L45]
MGTPAFAVPTLAALVEAGHDIAAVYTRAPKPAGRRGLDLTPSPIQVFAESQGLPVVTPKTLRGPEAEAVFAGTGATMGIVVGYGMLLPPSILGAVPQGCLNLHPSLLPRWRGAAPIQRPIMAGDMETAAAIMRMDEGLDTGPVALSETVPIPPDATAGAMHDQLAALGARLMVQAVAMAEAGTLVFTPQAEAGVVYAQKIDKAEARLDWSAPAAEVHNKIRGLAPFPGAFFEADFGKGPERVKVLRARLGDGSGEPGTLLDDVLTVACGTGAVQLLQIQRAGKAPMEASAFLRGTPLEAGTVLRC